MSSWPSNKNISVFQDLGADTPSLLWKILSSELQDILNMANSVTFLSFSPRKWRLNVSSSVKGHV